MLNEHSRRDTLKLAAIGLTATSGFTSTAVAENSPADWSLETKINTPVRNADSNGDYLAIGLDTGEIQIHDTDGFDQITTLNSPNGGIRSLEINAQYLAAGTSEDDDGNVYIFDIQSNFDHLTTLTRTDSSTHTSCLSFDDQREYIIYGDYSGNREVFVHGTDDWEYITSLWDGSGWTENPRVIDAKNDIVMYGGTGGLWFDEIGTWDTLYDASDDIDDRIKSADISPDGNWAVAVADDDAPRQVLIYDLSDPNNVPHKARPLVRNSSDKASVTARKRRRDTRRTRRGRVRRGGPNTA